MPRVVCVCLNDWPVTRVRRDRLKDRRAAGPAAEPEPDDGVPLCVAAPGPGGLRLVALDAGARALGLVPGEPLGRVRARVGAPLRVLPADPEADARALLRLCRWATRYAPVVAPFGPAEGGHGFFLDVEGASHLHGGEAALVADLAGRLARAGIPARTALADTPGGAFALARYGPADRGVVPAGAAARALRDLPVAGLRLDPGTLTALRRLGIARIGALDALPRAALARRFGAALVVRLDQALARRPEPLGPLTEAARFEAVRGFLDPIGRQSDVVAVARGLMAALAPRLERAGLGACALRLSLHRVDGRVRALDIGLSRPERCAARVADLVALRLDRLGSALDAGFGFEAVGLSVTVTGALPARQGVLGGAPRGDAVAALADALAQRLGRRLLRLAPRESHRPERAEMQVSAHGDPDEGVRAPRTSSPLCGGGYPGREAGSGEGQRDGAGCGTRRDLSGRGAPLSRPLNGGHPPPQRGEGTRGTLPDHQPRPLVLFPRAEPAHDVLSTVPDGPPRRFRWRAVLHRVARAEGPERIAPEWWREGGPGHDASHDAWRDYYRIECEAGRRLWLYRDGGHAPDRPAAWFVHGLFA